LLNKPTQLSEAVFDKDEFVIELLKYGATDLSIGCRGLTYDDIKAGMQAFGYQIETPEEHQKIWQVIREAFVFPEGMGGDKRYYLSLDSFFNLLDYMEFSGLEHHQNLRLNH
jgi:hypothetical protein